MVIALRTIQSGHTRSCGCSKRNNPLILNDLTGKRVGRLTVLYRDNERDFDEYGNRNKGVAHWMCKCDCGNMVSVTAYRLSHSQTKSCGCIVSEMVSERNKRDATKINHVAPYKYNETEECDDYYKVFNEDLSDYFLVDKQDIDYVTRWFWRKDHKGYWVTNKKKDDNYDKYGLRVHQLIAERKYGEYDTKTLFPDHLNRNKSDNRRCNLELKTNMDNMKNRSTSKANKTGKTGVCYSKDNNKFAAYITVNYKTHFLGYYSDLDDAVKVRRQAEDLYGFTCDNITASEVIK